MTTAAIQGEPGSFSHVAARQTLGEDVEVLPYRTFPEVFEGVRAGEAAYGILPVENALVGSIHENYDLLSDYALPIVSETDVRVSLALIARPGTPLAAVRRVHSHPVALMQCRNFLVSLPGAVTVTSHDTAGSVRQLMEGGAAGDAAVASTFAAALYGAAVLAEGIEDDPHNFTRFVAVAREPVRPQGPHKTSLLFTVRHEPGALWRSLEPFARRGLNLTKIESRPLRGRPWEYVFYLDVWGAQDATPAVDELRKVADNVRVLGCFDRAGTSGMEER